MGCGCGKGAVVDLYEVILSDGRVQVAKGEVEARTMIARAGGGTMKKKN